MLSLPNTFDKKTKIFFVALFCLTISLWFLLLTYFAVPFFKILCQDTGPNGLYGVFLDLKSNSFFFSWLYESWLTSKKLLKSSFFYNYLFYVDSISLKNGFLINENNQVYFNNIPINLDIVFKIHDDLPLTFRSLVPPQHVVVNNTQLVFCQVKNLSNFDDFYFM